MNAATSKNRNADDQAPYYYLQAPYVTKCDQLRLAWVQ